MLKAGFARLDITPTHGINLAGYFFERPAEDILDPLYAIAVAFDDGEKKAVVLSVDNLGINALILDAYRDTYEKLIDNSRCMYINGAQGDTNHIDVRLGEDKCRKGYDRIRYMGRKIAMAAVANYELAEEISGDEIKFARKGVIARHNRGKAEEIEPARELMKLHAEYGDPNKIPNIAERFPMFKGNPNVQVAAARRIASLQELPEERKLWLSALAIGDVVFAGFPGEPFTESGRSVKKNSRFALTIPSCCSGGYEGYFPMMDSYDEEGYEKSTARFVRGTAEKLIDEMTDLINSLN